MLNFKWKRKARRVSLLECGFDCSGAIVRETVREQAPDGVDVDELMAVLQRAQEVDLGAVTVGAYRERARRGKTGPRVPSSWWAEGRDSAGEAYKVAWHGSLVAALTALVESTPHQPRPIAWLVSDGQPVSFKPYKLAPYAAMLRGGLDLSAARYAQLDPGSAAAAVGPRGKSGPEVCGAVVHTMVDEAAVALDGAQTFVIELAGDEPRPHPFLVEPGGKIGWHGFRDDDPSRLVGFQRVAVPGNVDVDLPAFSRSPERAIGMFPLFECRGVKWTGTAPVASVRVADADEVPGPGRDRVWDGQAAPELAPPASLHGEWVEFEFDCSDQSFRGTVPAGVDPEELTAVLQRGDTAGLGVVWAGALRRDGDIVANSWWVAPSRSGVAGSYFCGHASLAGALTVLVEIPMWKPLEESFEVARRGPLVARAADVFRVIELGRTGEAATGGQQGAIASGGPFAVQAAVINSGRTFEIEVGDDESGRASFSVAPGGGVEPQDDLWKGEHGMRLIGFRRGMESMDLDLVGFDADPQAAVDMYPIFEAADGRQWSRDEPVVSVRATSEAR